MEASAQEEIDNKMIELDSTNNKSRLGANAILGVSMASSRSQANSEGKHLFEYLNSSDSYIAFNNIVVPERARPDTKT